jgi:curved DNA-binding protein CbpA
VAWWTERTTALERVTCRSGEPGTVTVSPGSSATVSRSGRSVIILISLRVLVDSPFEVLEVDPDADAREISRAYRRRVIETHPDQGGSAREFQRVKAAYEEIKAGYDGDALESRESVERSTADSRDPGASDEPDEEPEPQGVHVEYLNYEVLADHGWDLDDEDLFEKAAAANLDPSDCGRFRVQPDDRESLLQAAENCGFAWPYACRGGACANCAVAVTEGDLEMPAGHILSNEMLDRGIELSCIGVPITDELKVVYNVKHLPDLDELRLPASRFEKARLND